MWCLACSWLNCIEAKQVVKYGSFQQSTPSRLALFEMLQNAAAFRLFSPTESPVDIADTHCYYLSPYTWSVPNQPLSETRRIYGERESSYMAYHYRATPPNKPLTILAYHRRLYPFGRHKELIRTTVPFMKQLLFDAVKPDLTVPAIKRLQRGKILVFCVVTNNKQWIEDSPPLKSNKISQFMQNIWRISIIMLATAQMLKRTKSNYHRQLVPRFCFYLLSCFIVGIRFKDKSALWRSQSRY